MKLCELRKKARDGEFRCESCRLGGKLAGCDREVLS